MRAGPLRIIGNNYTCYDCINFVTVSLTSLPPQRFAECQLSMKKIGDGFTTKTPSWCPLLPANSSESYPIAHHSE